MTNHPQEKGKSCTSKHHYCMCDCLPCKTDSCNNCNLGNYPHYKTGELCHDACTECCQCVVSLEKEVGELKEEIERWKNVDYKNAKRLLELRTELKVALEALEKIRLKEQQWHDRLNHKLTRGCRTTDVGIIAEEVLQRPGVRGIYNE